MGGDGGQRVRVGAGHWKGFGTYSERDGGLVEVSFRFIVS